MQTTIHGSHLISTSGVFCCKECGSSVAYVMLPYGDLAYECTSPTCGKTISLDCADQLPVVDDLAQIGQAVLRRAA